ncbi:MAG: LPP20 family lipoprotein [Bacteroidetes bacterium]|nr:LPP20 family lipoprotein [Bacteroidota bacterium]
MRNFFIRRVHPFMENIILNCRTAKKFIFLFTIIGATASFAQTPSWYTTQNHPSFPKSTYLIGVGSGSGVTGLDAAKKTALADLVSQLRVQIQSEMNSVTKSYKMNDDEDLYSDFKKQTRTVVSDELTGAEIAETYVDPSSAIAYAMAVLNKITYSQSIAAELESGWKQAADLREQAKEYFGKGRLVEAIQSIHQIRQVIAPLFAKQVLHNAVAGKPFASQYIFNPNALQSDIRSFLSNVVIEKKMGDNQKGKIGEPFGMPLMVSVFVKQGESKVPCNGVPVEFVYGEKTILGTGVTDEQGNAALLTTIKPVVNGGIQARISLPDLGREFQKNIAASAVTFKYTAAASDKKFSLQVQSSSKKISDNLSKKITQAVTKAGYTISPSSDLVLKVETQSGSPIKVEGMAGTLYSCQLDVIVTLSEKKSAMIKSSAKFSAKGVGKTEAEGLEKAAESLTIDDRIFSELLEK